MNEIGAYWGLDMEGLDPAWYEDVPIEVQRRLVAAYPQHRILFSRRLCKTAVIQREPLTAQRWADGGFLRGWMINLWWDAPIGSGEDLIDYLFKVDRWKKVGKAKADRQEDLDAGMAKWEEKQQAQSDADMKDCARDYLSPVLSGSTTMEKFGSARRKELEKSADEASGKRHARRRKVSA